jgi:transcriptional regulator GlxA family with amidase domain
MRRVVIVAFADLQPLDVVGPHEVFAVASQSLVQRRSPRAGYTLEIAAPRTGRLTGEGGLSLYAGTALARLAAGRPLDTLIVAGGLGARHAARQPRIVQQIQRAAGRARRVASVCTGAFLLAAAGLLDGRRATTHWAYADRLSALRPAVRVDPDPIYVRDGRLWTSAGVTAGIDLALAMVEEDLGHEIAIEVARSLVVFVRRAGGQSQFSAQLAAQAAARSPIRDLQALIAEHPEADLDVPALARRAAMSVRNFSRVFRAEVGLTPASYVESVRLETARRLLETTALPVEGVATAAGFGTPESLRRALARRVGLSPREYRSRFGARAPFSGGRTRERSD